MQLTPDQRLQLDKMEQWQFLSTQIWTHDVGNFITSLFELFVFFIAIFSMDYTKHTPHFLLEFTFECKKGHPTIWWIEYSVKSSTLWELHTIIVFMYTTLAIVVMSTIPFKYDRFVKTEKEIAKDERKAKKKEAKRAEKKKRRKVAKLERLKQSLLL